MKTWNPKQDPFANREKSKYEHPIPSRELILDFITQHQSTYSRKQLMTHFGLQTAFEKEAFRRRLRAMVRDGQLVKNRKAKYSLIKASDLIHGRVLGHKEGIGFVRPEDGTKDIFLPVHEMRKVFDGDLVNVRIIGMDKRNRREGIIVDILERKHKQIVGKFFIESGIGFVEPDNTRIAQDIIIPPQDQLDAKVDQIVIAEIVTPPTKRAYAIGRIVEILGDYMAPGMETEVAIRAFDLPHEWPEELQDEIKQLPEEVLTNDQQGRADLRDFPLVTIDGEDAKDFDDAVYCEKKPKGGWRLIVAIADVGHYVKPNSALDKEAKKRGTSVYFTGRVLPMLPHVLSNGLCSLKPNVDRLCVVCDMSIAANGKISRYRFYQAIIHSHARLTYTKVAKMLEGDTQLIKQYKNVWPYLQNLHELYRALHQVRLARGALDFEMPEIKVEFEENRKIKRLYPIVRNDAHRIIEECMLCANTCAAKFLLKNKCDALFRVHDGPDATKFAELKEFLKELGLSLGGGDLPTPIDYAKLIEKIQNRPDAHLIQTILLRSMTQAFYSPENDGHFGLAYDEYTHFTSPIRRYPDLIVHRAICAVIDKSHKSKGLPDYEKLQVLGEHCSMTERRADDATYEALDWLKCEYMMDKLGQDYEGIISGVTGFGIFVELKNIFVEGLIHITALEDDYYFFDAVRHQLVGERTGKIYRLGDTLKIKVARVSLEDKQIDFVLA
ncbi:MAG: ribonuclease R [Gammaproteobacteria bacterium]|jgi:ribonuclease R